MIRSCPRCRAFYADDAPPFCPADGAPLVEVDPRGGQWTEAARAVEERREISRRQARRLRRSRWLTRVTTVVITTLVLCVVVVNGVIYLRHEPPPTATTPATTLPSPTADAAPRRPNTTPDPTQTAGTLRPVEDAGDNDNNRNTNNRNRNRNDNRNAGAGEPTCNAADRKREREAAVGRARALWERGLERERSDLVTEHGHGGRMRPAAELGAVSFDLVFIRPCAAARVTVKYEWKLSSPLLPRTTFKRERTFQCRKARGAWSCG